MATFTTISRARLRPNSAFDDVFVARPKSILRAQ
jgi:hypothetical protein